MKYKDDKINSILSYFSLKNRNEMSDIKRLLQKINQYEFSKEIDSIDIRKSSHWMKIYKEMQKIYMRLLENPPRVEVSSKPISKEEMKQITDGSRFMSHEIGKDILKRFHYQWTFVCDKGEVILNTFSEKEKLTKSEMEEMNEMILVIFLIKDLFHRNEKYIQKVTYFPSNLKKKINLHSKKCLGVNECNSGLTFVDSHSNHNHIDNGDIILFRREEHIKVLIHEMFHSNYRDVMLIRHDHRDEMADKICTDYDILLNESYTEWNATILNLMYLSIKYDMKISELNDMLHKEIKYGVYVCRRIMKYYGIQDISEIIRVGDFCKKHIPQKTNVISYYLFKPLQMFHFNQMEKYLKKRTKEMHIVDQEGAREYKEMILEWLPTIQDQLIIISKKSGKNQIDSEKSLRMTLFS
jgi:hypothetical protein